ncbi:DHA2 family efflux MFS transporter permease subunit [Aquipuribacter nitratireducens]|uniref:MDR family MFS transporter n=1 Tax=Aquipuribacter nitratireducens TaxID=650104 RepID=A0ABW0GR86_9MICO
MTAAAPTEAAPALTQRQIYAIFGGLVAGMFLAALDQTIVATAIRTIADDLQGLSLQAWTTTAYLITATITTPLYGKLSDLYGRKPLFLTAITVFVAGSVLCAFATSMVELALFRAVQGLGAGGLFSLALAIVGDIVPPRERARYQGFFLAVFGTASVLGPVVGGFFAGADSLLGITGWRWVFLVNVPVGAVALAVVVRVLHIPHTRRPHRIDWPGALLLAVGLVPLLLLAEQGREWGWTSNRSLALAAVGVVGLVGFVLAERRIGDDALLPLRLFRSRTFALGSVSGLVIGMAMFGGLAALPLYLQIVKGQSPTVAGLALLPLTLGIMTGSITSGQLIARTGRYKVFPVVGTSLLVVGLVLFAQVTATTPLWQTSLVMVLFGLGLGGTMQPLVLAVQNAVPATDIGVATSSATFFRQMGGTLGTAVFLSILFGTVGDRIAQRFATALADPAFRATLTDPAVLAEPANAEVAQQLADAQAAVAAGGTPAVAGTGVLDDSSFLGRLDPVLAFPFQAGFADAMQLLFWVGAAITVVGVVVVSLLPEEPLRTQSALEEREQALAAERAALAAATPVAPVASPDAAEGPDGRLGDDPARPGSQPQTRA